MGLEAKEGVLSHFIDLLIGAVAAAVAFWIYLETEQAIWPLLLLLATAAGMVWFRMRDHRETPPDERLNSC